MLELWVMAVSITVPVFGLMGALASENFRERFTAVLIGGDDLETTSSKATEALIGQLTGREDSGLSIRKVVVLSVSLSLLLLLLMRALWAAPPFFDEAWAADERALALGLCLAFGVGWFAVTLLVSRFFLRQIQDAGNIAQNVLAIALPFIAHFLIALIVWLALTVNIGAALLISLEGANYPGVAVGLFGDLFVVQNGVEQLLFAEYFVAFSVAILYWMQTVIGVISRALHDRREPEKQNSIERMGGPLRSFIRRFIFGTWADPSKHPFSAAALLAILIEGAVIFGGGLVLRLLAMA